MLAVPQGQPFDAGLIQTVALFAPIEDEASLPRTAFVLPDPTTTRIAVVPAKKPTAKVKPPPVEEEAVATPVLLTYAPAEDAGDVPPPSMR